MVALPQNPNPWPLTSNPHCPIPFNERHLAVCRLLRPRPFPVDIVVKTPDELHYEVESNNYFIREIATRGEVVYELGN